MTKILRCRWAVFGLTCLLAVSAVGCGSKGPPPREDILAIPAEEHYGGSTKTMLYEFCAKVRKRGVKAAQQAVPEVLGNMEGYEKQALGKHADLYKKIFDKLKEIETMVGGASPNAATLKQAVEELDEMTDQLPGKAVENPVVE